jgi:hypothetical protein
MKHNRAETIFEVSKLILSGQPFQATLGNFLDGFYSSPKKEALNEAPLALKLDQSVFLCAVAEMLSNQFGFPAPKWADDPLKAFEPPQFSVKNPKLQAVLLEECPIEFKRRGLIVSANVLSRA